MQSNTQIEFHIGRPSTPEHNIAQVRSGSLKQLLRDSVGAATLTVVLDNSRYPVGEIGDIARTIPQLERLFEVAIRTKRALDPHEVSSLTELRRAAERRGARFVVDFCLDNQANAFAVLDRKATSLSPILEGVSSTSNQEIDVRWYGPITRPLVHRLEAIFSLAGNDQIDAVLVPSWMIRAHYGGPEWGLDDDDTLFVRDFLAYRLLEEDLHRLTPERKAFYRAMLATLDGSGRILPDTSHCVAVLRQSRTVSAEWALHYETRPRLPVRVGVRRRARWIRSYPCACSRGWRRTSGG